MRILQIGKYYSPHKGGMETHLKALCGELQRSVDLKVIVGNGSRPTTDDLDSGVRVTRVKTMFNLAAAPICPEMIRKIREDTAELIHLHLPNPPAVLAYLASGHKGRLIITYHSDIIRQKMLGHAFEPVLRYALNRSAAIIATSPDYVAASPVLSTYGDRCRIIPLGIAVEQYEHCDHAAVARIRERYGPRIVVGVGRLVYYKGFEYLIRAMAQVRGRLLIVGDGPLRARLEREAREHHVEGRVEILGGMEDVRPYYHAADVFVLPSVARSEAFGIVQLEAMACGKPVVNTRLASGVPFVSLDGVTGLTVPPASPEALANAINLLLDDPERRGRYGEAARTRVQQEFSLELMTERTLQLYREVLETSNGS